MFLFISMKKIVLLLFLASFLSAPAQNSKNNTPNAIVGTYSVNHGGQQSKVRVYKEKNGTYTAQCIWLKDSIDPKTGKMVVDEKNPDKSLRHTPCNQIIIFHSLEYNAKKHRWDSGKVYDPTRGIVANCTCEFQQDGRLKMRGSLMGIGETILWTPLPTKSPKPRP